MAGEQKYHPECFSCLNCRTFIGDGDTYALVERSKLYWYVCSGGRTGGTHPRHPHPPSCSVPHSGHCYYQMVVTPVIEQILPDSPASRIPHTVTLVSIPACSDGKRGFSVSIDQGCGTEHPRTVRVRECVPVPSATVPSPGLGHPMPLGSIPGTPFGVGGSGVGLGCPRCPGVAWGPWRRVPNCRRVCGGCAGVSLAMLALPRVPEWAVVPCMTLCGWVALWRLCQHVPVQEGGFQWSLTHLFGLSQHTPMMVTVLEV